MDAKDDLNTLYPLPVLPSAYSAYLASFGVEAAVTYELRLL